MEKEAKKTVSTSRLLSSIRGAASSKEAVSYHETNPEPQLKDVLYALLQKNGFQPKDIILESGIERSYFYHIISGNKKPSRNMMLRIGFCARANPDEMNHLLRLGDLPCLYPKIRRDALLLYAFSHKLSMAQANNLLNRENEAPLYREEKHE
ncbi:MAG: hypothetical protein IIY55_07350 [Blautia sp.]|nr:hypothetical protein [Blautia sp.]